eukprot:TRINITY_DN13977_c0_g1_i2.p1 TRINITY_DN13977_c0_g1~~TRINITY_DN13977_c0_g1_i2.p1  ORF type:complete len:555 (+),score=85.96 TRINITY_DN13977_c0_g1_i2:49-1713(+)
MRRAICQLRATRNFGAPSRRYNSCQYLIVGGGTAGCVLANRLSAGGKSVVMLEAGGEDDWIWLKIPVGYLYAMMNPRSDWCFRTVEQEGLNNRTIAYPRGKVLGGCSSINGAIYMRGQQADYEEWEKTAPGWSWNDVLPYYKKSMSYYLGEDELHGTGGEWRVEHPRVHWGVLDSFQEAAIKHGIPLRDHFNNSDEQGVGYFQVNHRNGVRVSASTAFLKPVLYRNNLRVIKHAMATKILTDGNDKVTGIQYKNTKTNEITTITADETILTAGAIGSPHLLQVSGLGPQEELEKHGVPVVKNIPGVGKNLHDHLQIRPTFKLRAGTDTLNQRTHSIFSKIKMGMQYALDRSGPLSMAPSQMGLVAKSCETEPTPDLEFHVQPLTLGKLETGDLDSFPGLTVSVCDLRPTSRGTVTLSSPSIETPPLIDPKYLSTEIDRIKVARGIRLIRNIVGEDSFINSVGPQEMRPGISCQTDDELADAAAGIASSIFHPVSTCKMGLKSDVDAVVDERLRMHHMKGIRIVDASIMPRITSGNTCSPVVMIAEKAADMILED